MPRDLSLGINRISSNEISIDVSTLKTIDSDINKAIEILMNDIYRGKKYNTNQFGDILYVYIDSGSEGFNNIERYVDEIKYVIFSFKDSTDSDKLLKIKIQNYKKKNYIIYILLLLIILLIIYIILRTLVLNSV